ncbi:hypothetical protein [Massilia sp. TS11]|uniref:hypothetical protein n=1 Tax=Massilia sp. TS11 TaxID=2908003 RepID=UPI001EDAD0B1|nr:hypothetical protein [Massilia sp. TS11]MCG2585775.1 hypothetical protein [Massilia sp. TS11]
MQDYQRPPTLHRYGQRADLELALREGQFRLVPHGPCLSLSFSSAWDQRLFDVLAPADCCLVIHHTEAFGERLHRAVQQLLPAWAGIDGAIDYAGRSPLGPIFCKDPAQKILKEWMFAWRPTTPGTSLHPVTVRMGNLEAFAELRARDAYLA